MPNADGSPTPEEEYWGMSGGTPPVGPVPSGPDLGAYYGVMAPPVTVTSPGPTGDPFAAGAAAAGIAPVQAQPPAPAPAPPSPAPAPAPQASPPAAPEGSASAPVVRRPDIAVTPTVQRGEGERHPEEEKQLFGAPGGFAPSSAGGGAPTGPFAGPNAAILSSILGEKQATERLGAAEAGKALAISEGRATLAREQQEEAAIQQEQARFQREELQAHLREADQQLAAIREQRIDPNRLLSDTGSRVLAVIGGVFGGMYQGMNRLANNPFMDAMNRAIDRDIDSQEKNIRHQREGVQDKFNLIGHLRTAFKDEELARIQARQLYLEGAKQYVEAEAARYDSPIVMAKSGVAMSALDRMIAETQKQFAKEAKAIAAAAAAAKAANARRQWEMDKERAELEIKAYQARTGRIAAETDAGKEGRATEQASMKLFSEKLGDPKYVEAKTLINEMLPKVIDPKTGELAGGVPGVGHSANVREDVFPAHPNPALNFIPGYSAAHYYGKGSVGTLSPEERTGRQAMERLFDAYRVAVTGAGAGTTELDKLHKSFIGEGTPEEQKLAINHANDILRRVESSVAQTNPAAYEKYIANAGRVREIQKAQQLPPGQKVGP